MRDSRRSSSLILFQALIVNSLTPRPVTVIMKTAGGGRKNLEANLFELDLVERNGNCHRIWGYGVDTILEPDDPVDPALSGICSIMFPKKSVKIQKRRIDILMETTVEQSPGSSPWVVTRLRSL